MKDLPKALSDYEFCRGEAPDGTQKCGYREQCKRYLQGGYRVVYMDFYKYADDDCKFYESKGESK